jgi:hypothetical protein
MADVTVPADLSFSGTPDPSDKNYWDVKIPGLKPSQLYGIQFQWLFADGTKSGWSANREVLTSQITAPGQPAMTALGGPGYIAVSYSGLDSSGGTIQDISRVDIYISGAPFDGSKPADSFSSPGTKTITAPAGDYIVKLKAVRPDGTTTSLFSSTSTVTVQGVGTVVQKPTLPSGLAVTPVAFGVRATWDGSYSDQSFAGFKSIIINASTTNLGPSVTTEPGAPVAQLSVNNSFNAANIGLSAYVGYDFDTYFYYIASNTDGTLYKDSSNVTRWTRINAIGVRPIKANVVDLANGIISIENLVAGNGNFTTYLLAGTPGGARVTLSGLTTTYNGVDPGFRIYKSDGTTEAFSADLAGNVKFGGELTGATGTFKGALNVGTISNNKYPFSVSSSGVLRAVAGAIGGFTIDETSLQANNNTFQLDSTNGRLSTGTLSGSHIEIDGTNGIIHKSSSSATGNFQLTPSGTLTLGTDLGTNHYFQWNGSTLNIKGAITITSGKTYDDLEDVKTNVGGIVTLTSALTAKSKTLQGLVDFYDGLDTLLYGDYTKIDGGRISTGIIKSTQNITIDGTSYPVSQINLNTGEFIFGGGSLAFNADTTSASLIFNKQHTNSFEIRAMAGTGFSSSYSSFNWDGTSGASEDNESDTNTTIANVDNTSVTLLKSETIGIIKSGSNGTDGPYMMMSSSSGGLAKFGATDGTYNSYINFNSGVISLYTNRTGGIKIYGLGSTPHYNYSYSDIPTTLNISSNGTLSRGRAFFRSKNTEANILTGYGGTGYSWIGQSGDIIFSTSD